MKNISYIINGVLAVAIIVLFILFFTSNKKGTEGGSASLNFAEGDSTGVLPVAYVNVDSLLINYNYAKDANDVLMKEYNSANATLNNKQRQFENEVADFRKKLENNVFLSQERAQQEQTRIQKIESDLHATAQRLQDDYMRKQAKMNAQVTDSVRTCLKEYNKKANYQIIFSNTGLDNVLLAKDSYDITKDVIVLLNSRYKPEAAK
ncbi:OmpH family outer membrane protein [Prevotella sp. 10(H)]|uniref:OmpH family outer membrane protein n=1 Tax=Prevotella sp. 10(H) TaxID=1158294 RepID=UPI0004A6D195|nr:OmpH family outer membrane protein [Prevotella sp. 10(H)]